jgi:hypothetical protein
LSSSSLSNVSLSLSNCQTDSLLLVLLLLPCSVCEEESIQFKNEQSNDCLASVYGTDFQIHFQKFISLYYSGITGTRNTALR